MTKKVSLKQRQVNLLSLEIELKKYLLIFRKPCGFLQMTWPSRRFQDVDQAAGCLPVFLLFNYKRRKLIMKAAVTSPSVGM